MSDSIVIYLQFSGSYVGMSNISLGASVPGRTATLAVAVAFWGS